MVTTSWINNPIIFIIYLFYMESQHFILHHIGCRLGVGICCCIVWICIPFFTTNALNLGGDCVAFCCHLFLATFSGIVTYPSIIVAFALLSMAVLTIIFVSSPYLRAFWSLFISFSTYFLLKFWMTFSLATKERFFIVAHCSLLWPLTFAYPMLLDWQTYFMGQSKKVGLPNLE